MKNLLVFLLLYSNLSFSQTIIDSTEILSYYDTIIYYTEYSKVRTFPLKYTEDIKIYVKGEKIDYLNEELDTIIKELNDLIESVNITLTTDSNDYNLLVFLGSLDNFRKINNYVKNFKNFSGCAISYGDYNNSIILSECFVDVINYNDKNYLKHVLREEVTQCLGFSNDTYQYKNSIFYQGHSSVNEYSDIDKEIIKLHYR